MLIVNSVYGSMILSRFFTVLLLFVALSFAFLIEAKIRSGQFVLYKGSSYAKVLSAFARALYIPLVVGLLAYLSTNSTEVAISLGLYAFACVVAGFVMAMLYEFQAKRRK